MKKHIVVWYQDSMPMGSQEFDDEKEACQFHREVEACNFWEEVKTYVKYDQTKFLINGVEVSKATYEYYQRTIQVQRVHNFRLSEDPTKDKDFKALNDVKFEEVGE